MAISIISLLIGFYVIEALASLFLIHGASNNKRLYLVPWMVERATQLMFYTILWLSIGFYLLTSPQTFAYSLMTIIFGGVSLCKLHSFKISITFNSFMTFFNFYCSLQLLLLHVRLLIIRFNEGCRRISTFNKWPSAFTATKLWKHWHHLC